MQHWEQKRYNNKTRPCVVLVGVSTGAGEEAEDGFGEEQKEVGR